MDVNKELKLLWKCKKKVEGSGSSLGGLVLEG